MAHSPVSFNDLPTQSFMTVEFNGHEFLFVASYDDDSRMLVDGGNNVLVKIDFSLGVWVKGNLVGHIHGDDYWEFVSVSNAIPSFVTTQPYKNCSWETLTRAELEVVKYLLLTDNTLIN